MLQVIYRRFIIDRNVFTLNRYLIIELWDCLWFNERYNPFGIMRFNVRYRRAAKRLEDDIVSDYHLYSAGY